MPPYPTEFNTMIVRFALSIGALAMVLGLLVAQVSQHSASTAAVSDISPAHAESSAEPRPLVAASPVVLPVERSDASLPPSFVRVAEGSIESNAAVVKSVQHIRPAEKRTSGTAKDSARSTTAANASTARRLEMAVPGPWKGKAVNELVGPVAVPAKKTVKGESLDTLAFDDDLADSNHQLSQASKQSVDVAGDAAARRLANARILTVAESSRRLQSLPTSLPSKDNSVEELDDLKKDELEGSLADDVVEPRKELSPRMKALKSRLEAVMNFYRPKMVNSRDKGHWATMHSFIAFGVDKELRLGGPSGRKVNAIGWICWNEMLAGERLFYLRNGKIHARTGPGLQGHHGQFLGMLAQSRVRADYPMKISGRNFTVADLIKREQETCVPRSELTFKLIGLSHYLDSEETWKDEHGRNWSISRMVKEELAQPITGAACGGTHRLFGLTYAVKKRRKQGYEIDGQFARAEKFLDDFQKYTFKLQNSDGSYSTQYFAARGSDSRVAKRLETTGHTAEWLTLLLDEEQVRSDRMVKSMEYLSGMLYQGRHHEWKIGPLGHGLHAINMYHERVFGDRFPESMQVASDDGVVRTAAKATKTTGS